MKTFYTYLWLREDGTPYYVGKGNRDRAFTNHGRKVTRRPTDKTRILIQEFLSEQEAFEAEKFLISFYGRKDIGLGCLHNRTDGGDGSAGGVHSEETRKKQRDALLKCSKMLGKTHSLETRIKMRQAHLGQKKSEETRARMRIAKSNMSEETRRKMSESARRRVCKHAKNVESSASLEIPVIQFGE